MIILEDLSPMDLVNLCHPVGKPFRKDEMEDGEMKVTKKGLS